jgi:UDP-glucuronate 4-epimerase
MLRAQGRDRLQPGDVPATYADVAAISRDLGYAPKIAIDEGAQSFVRWFRQHHGN